jgi:hypothetical protein
MRAFAALAVTSLAAVTLLLGPDATLGLDMPTAGTGSVTQVTQQVTSTVQQTAQPVVTNVQTTVETTVQPTQQVATQVQQTAAPVAAAPQASTASPPVKRVVTAKPVRTIAAKPKSASSPTHAAVSSGPAAADALTTVTRTATRTRAAIRSTASPSHRTHSSGDRKPARQADSSCTSSSLLSTLGGLLGPLSQSTLGSLLCNATLLLAGAQPSLASNESTAGPRLGGVLAVIASSVPARLRVLAYAKSAAKSPFPLIGNTPDGRGHANAPAASVGPGTLAPAASVVAFGAASGAAAHATGDQVARTSDGSGHGGLFGSSVTGTEAIFALLVADWALLVAVVMWKLARRRRRLAFGF